MKNKKIISLLLIFAVISSLICGCGTKNNSETTSDLPDINDGSHSSTTVTTEDDSSESDEIVEEETTTATIGDFDLSSVSISTNEDETIGYCAFPYVDVEIYNDTQIMYYTPNGKLKDDVIGEDIECDYSALNGVTTQEIKELYAAKLSEIFGTTVYLPDDAFWGVSECICATESSAKAIALGMATAAYYTYETEDIESDFTSYSIDIGNEVITYEFGEHTIICDDVGSVKKDGKSLAINEPDTDQPYTSILYHALLDELK